MCSWGAGLGVLAPCFFGSTQRTIVLDRLIPTPQTPGSCWRAEGTDRSPWDIPRQSPSLVLWWVHPWAHGPTLSSSPRSRNRDSEESVPSKEKAFGNLSNCADISEAHAAPSSPYPLTQGLTCPAPPTGPSPWAVSAAVGPGFGRPSFKTVGHRNILWHPLSLRHTQEVSRDGGPPERSRLWYREAGRVAEEWRDMSPL